MKFQYSHFSYSFEVEKGVEVKSIGFVTRVEKYLNELGNEGWRLVHEIERRISSERNTGHYNGLFMRETREPSEPGMESQCCKAIDKGDYKPLSEVIAEKRRDQIFQGDPAYANDDHPTDYGGMD